ERATDFSQARPELGHATNASAVVGRRSLTQGTFFDRRIFLISYDPTQDPDGKVLEGVLLAVGPVGAGINLEYYFSTVNNERFGCGSKVPHNITGFFGVMEGANSDLRTGLPQQMVEIHEPMRLQILVEAKTAVLEQIYTRQESLRELIAGGWVHLSTKDPDSGEIFIFECGAGFVPWQAETEALPVYEKSPDCYRDQTLPVPPALIKQPELLGVV
ncbi:MAG: Na-translocating system protein MpsB, partial [Methylobacter sp.]|nr:Na-translocating system protein MpsB [Methylobacter sp.]